MAERLDPDIATLFADVNRPVFEAATSRDGIPAMRERRFLAVELSDNVERNDHLVGDDPAVRVRVHRPKGLEGPLPCVVSLHGGGYIVGSYEGDDVRHDRLCQKLGYVGVAIDYRLAPETPYPGPLEDCYTGLKWVHENATTLGVDPERIGVFGASAGGGLAAGLGLLARDRGEVPIAFQQLIYPMLDDRRCTATSSWDALIWSPASNELGWSCYLGDLFGTEDVPAYAAAARGTDLAGLPPTFICVGTLDLFCDENIDFAKRLNHAGVPVELHVYPGAPHGFDMMMAQSEPSRRCLRDQEEWLARRLL
jgi:acetyl esterase/lipase